MLQVELIVKLVVQDFVELLVDWLAEKFVENLDQLLV